MHNRLSSCCALYHLENPRGFGGALRATNNRLRIGIRPLLTFDESTPRFEAPLPK